MTRKEVAFEYRKRYAERIGEPFPYNNLEEWEADAPKREAERKRYWSQKHVWLEDFSAKDNVYYNFIDPETGKEISVNLYQGSCDTYWDITLDIEGRSNYNIAPLLSGPYTFEQLQIAKIDIIQVLKKLFPKVNEWNDDVKIKADKITSFSIGDWEYPSDLYLTFNLYAPEDIPTVLYSLGNIRLLRPQPFRGQRIAIIGSRTPDEQGLHVAFNLGRFFANDIVVSGLAKGIDTAAHKGCLDAKGKTIAVVGSGLMHVHPKENTDLQKRIIETGGMILSEQDPKTKASPRTLIARTRLQVALADKVYVVECEKESGTMHAVNFALKYGKPIYALDCEWSGNRYLIDNGFAQPF